MNPKLKILERQLSKPGGRDTGESPMSDKMVGAIRSVVEEEYQEEIAAAKHERQEAQEEAVKLRKQLADTAELRKQVADLHKEILNIQSGGHVKMDAIRSASREEMDNMCKEHMAEMKVMQSKIEALQTELVQVREARMRAETQKEDMDNMCSNLRETIAQLRSVKPAPKAAAPEPQQPRPVTAKVTQRDENGRIVAISIS